MQIGTKWYAYKGNVWVKIKHPNTWKCLTDNGGWRRGDINKVTTLYEFFPKDLGYFVSGIKEYYESLCKS